MITKLDMQRRISGAPKLNKESLGTSHSRLQHPQHNPNRQCWAAVTHEITIIINKNKNIIQEAKKKKAQRITIMVSAVAATATASASSQLLVSSSRSLSRLSPFQLCVFDSKTLVSCPSNGNGGNNRIKRRHVRCMAVGTTPEAETKKSGFEIQTLTGWLLKQEQAGTIDAELTIVISSISMACKQIASLVQRASISNLTGVQGAVNVQGEDQKKLDVVSNEVLL